MRTAMISGALRAWRSTLLDFEGEDLRERADVFTNYRLDVRFEHEETGASIIAPGYFAADGDAAISGASDGAIWRVRFRAPTAGVWRWRARFRTGQAIAAEHVASVDFAGATGGLFDGASGAVRIGPAKMTPPDLRARGAVALQGETLTFPQSGGAASALTQTAAHLLHGSEFDGARVGLAADALDPSDLAHWKPGDPEWDANGRGRAASGFVRRAAENGVNILRLGATLFDGDRMLSGPWRGDERAAFDISRLEQWAMLLHAAERLGVAVAIAPAGRDATGKAAALSALGLTKIEKRVLLRELVARFGHLNGLIWEVDAQTLGDERGYFIDLDPVRARAASSDFDALATVSALATPPGAASATSPVPAAVPAQKARRDKRSFESLEDVDAFLSGPHAIRLNSLAPRVLEALMNAAQAPDGPVKRGQKQPKAERPPSAASTEQKPAAPVDASSAPGDGAPAPNADTRSEPPAVPEETLPAPSPSPSPPAQRDYVGETEHFDEIDEALAELRKAQRAEKTPPQPSATRSGGVRAARRSPRASAQDDSKPRAAIAGIGDADAAAERLAFRDGDAKLPHDAPPTRTPNVAPNAAAISQPMQADARPAAHHPRHGGVESRVATPSFADLAKSPPPPPQEGAAAIALSLYRMGGGSTSTNAEPLSLTEPLDLAEIAHSGAALVARFAGSDAAAAIIARLGLFKGPADVAKSENAHPFSLFTGLEALASSIEEAAHGADAGGAAYLELSVFAETDAPRIGAGAAALKTWRVPIKQPQHGDETAEQISTADEPPAVSREALTAHAMGSDAHLVRFELIDPDVDRLVAQFGPAGFDAPIEAAGRVLNVKAVIGGRAVSALRARLFVPSAARCARPEDRPSQVGSEAACHFYGCVFAPGRQEIELVAVKDGAAMEQLLDAPETYTEGVLLRARVRISLT